MRAAGTNAVGRGCEFPRAAMSADPGLEDLKHQELILPVLEVRRLKIRGWQDHAPCEGSRTEHLLASGSRCGLLAAKLQSLLVSSHGCPPCVSGCP